MALFVFANNARTTIAAPISSTSTTVTLQSGSGALFPNPSAGQQFALTFNDAATGLQREITYCTARSGDTLTIIRGREGTTAQDWNTGDVARNLWTAGSAAAMVQVTQLQEQQTNYAVDTGTTNALVASLTPAPVSYSALRGAPIRIAVANTNTSATVTLNLNGLGPVNVVVAGASVACPPGALLGATVVEMIFDGTSFEVATPSVYTATAGWSASQTFNAETFFASEALFEDGASLQNNPPDSDNSQSVVSSSWVRNAMGNISSAAGGNVSTVTNGFIKLPSWLAGLIINWGTFNVTTATGSQILTPTLAQAYSTLHAFAIATTTGALISTAIGGDTNGNSLTTMRVGMQTNASPGQTINVFWFSIGF